jgi:hypothetical protein
VTCGWRAVCSGVIVLLVAMPTSGGQAAGPRPETTRAPGQVPRTPDGQPDLQGVWDFRTATPLERPRALQDQEFLDDQNRAAIERRAAERLRVQAADDPLLNTPPWWLDYGREVVRTKRSSLIVDPPDGRLPPMTPEGLKRQHDQLAARDAAEGPEGLTPWDRCITKGVPASMLPGAQNNNLQIVQTSDYVVIITEMIHEARIVPMKRRGALPAVRAWTGVSRGHWEGNTLVVETDQFAASASFLGSGGRLRLLERFTRIDAGTIDYRLTIDDPATWTKAWTVAVPLMKSDGPMYEYACHEGNYSMKNTLIAARAAERR